METPTKDRRSLHGILQPQSPNIQHQQHHHHSFSKYRGPICDDLHPQHAASVLLHATDSGYNSCLDTMSSSASTSAALASLENSPVLSSSSRSSLHRTSTGCNSSLLTPIPEDLELRSFGTGLRQRNKSAAVVNSTASASSSSGTVELTPRTQNAAQCMAAFHISTPDPMASNAYKRLLSTPGQSGGATAAKTRRLNTGDASRYFGEVTPTKRNAAAAGSRFMAKLMDSESGSAEGENSENSAPPTAATNTFHAMDFSPIHASASAAAPRGRQGAAPPFQRIASDHHLQSSTPIWKRGAAAAAAAACKPASPAGRLLRKWQSFSPSKVQHLQQQQQRQQLFDLASPRKIMHRSPAVSDLPGRNPARKLLDFNAATFESRPDRDHTPSASTAAPAAHPQLLPDLASPRKIMHRSPAVSDLPDRNPARKLLDFNAATFESLLGGVAQSQRLQRQPAVLDVSDSMCLDDDDFDAANMSCITPAKIGVGQRSNYSIATQHDLQLDTSIVLDSPPVPGVVLSGRSVDDTQLDASIAMASPVTTDTSLDTSSSGGDRDAPASRASSGFRAAHRLRQPQPQPPANTNATGRQPIDCDRPLHAALAGAVELSATPPQNRSFFAAAATDDSSALLAAACRSLRTPKKMQRSFSLQSHHQHRLPAHSTAIGTTDAPGSASRREQNRILYANLPCTPPKSIGRSGRRAGSHLKRLATTALGARRTPAKRKLYENDENRAEVAEVAAAAVVSSMPVRMPTSVPPAAAAPLLPLQLRRQRCSAGMDKLDVLGRLEFVLPAVERILRRLSTEDLGHVRQVSKRWRRIVEANRRAAQRVERMERRFEVAKENGGGRSAAVAATAAATAAAAALTRAKLRKPFNRLNSQGDWCATSMDAGGAGEAAPFGGGGGAAAANAEASAMIHSPPVSPTTRAFKDNQALVKTLKKTQRLMKCPRCSRCSVIDRCPAPATATHHHQNHHSTTHVPFTASAAKTAPHPINTNCLLLTRSASLQHHHYQPHHGATATPSLGAGTLPFARPQSLDWTDASDALDDSGYPMSSASSSMSVSVSAGSSFHASAALAALSASSPTSDSLSSSSCTPSPPTLAAVAGAHDRPTASRLEFGQCPSKQCGFRFCVACLCEFDGQHVRTQRCPRSDARLHGCHAATTVVVAAAAGRRTHQKQAAVAASGTGGCPVAGTKQSKRNLRRLFSLDA